MGNLEDIIERLQELEMKLAFQEDTIEQLSHVISKQDKELADLWTANKVLKQSMNEIKATGENEAPEPPPPHY